MSDFLRLSALVHGVPGAGKTRLAATAPGPVLFLDPEGGAKFLGKPVAGWEPRRITYWNPMAGPPPSETADGEPLGLNDVVIARVLDWPTAKIVQDWMISGQHVFRSFIVDTVTELQDHAKANIAPSFTDQRQWGELKDMGLLVARQWRDLLDHPTNPLFAVIILAHSEERQGLLRPMLQGALAKRIGAYYDVIGHLRSYVREDGIPSRELVIAPYPGLEAKDRTGILANAYPHGIIREPDISNILRIINNNSSNQESDNQ